MRYNSDSELVQKITGEAMLLLPAELRVVIDVSSAAKRFARILNDMPVDVEQVAAAIVQSLNNSPMNVPPAVVIADALRRELPGASVYKTEVQVAAEQAFAALVGSTASDDSVQGRARQRLREVLGYMTDTV